MYPAWQFGHNIGFLLQIYIPVFTSLFYRFLRRESILLASNLAASSMCSSVDHLPSVNRRAPSARSLDIPIAIKTSEGSVLPSEHADPVELPISGVSARPSSPIT